MSKQSTCCAKFSSAVMREKAEVARLTRIAIRAQEKGRPPARYLAKIASAKEHLAFAEQGVIDHEAEHAEDRISA